MSTRIKAAIVCLGCSFWFFVVTSAIGVFSFYLLILFVIPVFAVTQIFSKKLERILDYIAIINTRIFLGLLFVFVISVYGIIFKVLRIDLLRNNESPAWLSVQNNTEEKQY